MQQILTLWRIAQPPPVLLTAVSALLLVETATTLAIPWIGGRFAETVLGSSEATPYQQLLLIWCGLLVVQNILRFVSSYLLGSSGAAATSRLRCRIYDHLQALPLGFHQERDPGDTLSLLSRDAGILGQFFTSTLPNLAPQILTLVGAWLLMARLDLQLALMVGIAVPTIAVGLKLILRRIRPLASELAKAHGSNMAVVEENIRILEILKAFGRESLESGKVKRQNATILSLERRHLLLTGLIAPTTEIIGGVLLIAILWLSAGRLTSGALTPGDMVSLLLYGLLLFRPASMLATAAGNLQSTQGASQRLQSLLDSPTEPYTHGQTSTPEAPGKIQLKDVSFAYPGQDELFHGLNLDLQPGEILAITGPNGTGKSTLMRLLMRFIEPRSGRILIGGMDIRELNLNSLRGLIGLVPQQATLLNDTLRANITFGVPGATDREIEQAARQAQAWDLISALPDGLDTVIGPNGIRLSGGERQRIVLARALLRSCPILLLDEATSMFDSEGEAAFVEECKDSLKGRTVIIITHRQASLKMATRHLHFA